MNEFLPSDIDVFWAGCAEFLVAEELMSILSSLTAELRSDSAISVDFDVINVAIWIDEVDQQCDQLEVSFLMLRCEDLWTNKTRKFKIGIQPLHTYKHLILKMGSK